MNPMTDPIGAGYPDRFDLEAYLSADEVRSLGEFTYGRYITIGGRQRLDVSYCIASRCSVGATDPAHIARKQMGGRKHAGPVARLSREHHRNLDDPGNKCALGIRRSDGMLCWLRHTPHGTVVRQLALTPESVIMAHIECFPGLCEGSGES